MLQPPSVLDGRLALLAVSDQPSPLLLSEKQLPKSSIEEKAAAVGSKIAVGTVKAGQFVYDKGKELSVCFLLVLNFIRRIRLLRIWLLRSELD